MGEGCVCVGVCGVYRKMRVTRSIFYFLMKRLEHTSMQKERGIEKEAWFQEKEGLIHGVWPLEDSGGFWGSWWKGWGSQGGGRSLRDWAAAGYQLICMDIHVLPLSVVAWCILVNVSLAGSSKPRALVKPVPFFGHPWDPFLAGLCYLGPGFLYSNPAAPDDRCRQNSANPSDRLITSRLH